MSASPRSWPSLSESGGSCSSGKYAPLPERRCSVACGFATAKLTTASERTPQSLAASNIPLYRLPSTVTSDRQKERAHRERGYGFLRRTKVRLISNIVKGVATLSDRSTFVEGAL